MAANLSTIALSFKTKSVFITLTTLLGLVCAHPKLQTLLHGCAAVSLLGTIGGMFAFDRLLEYVNLLQSKRATAFVGFNSQLTFTELIQALLHVDASWKEANGQSTGLDDGIPAFL